MEGGLPVVCLPFGSHRHPPHRSCSQSPEKSLVQQIAPPISFVWTLSPIIWIKIQKYPNESGKYAWNVKYFNFEALPKYIYLFIDEILVLLLKSWSNKWKIECLFVRQQNNNKWFQRDKLSVLCRNFSYPSKFDKYRSNWFRNWDFL